MVIDKNNIWWRGSVIPAFYIHHSWKYGTSELLNTCQAIAESFLLSVSYQEVALKEHLTSLTCRAQPEGWHASMSSPFVVGWHWWKREWIRDNILTFRFPIDRAGVKRRAGGCAPKLELLPNPKNHINLACLIEFRRLFLGHWAIF